MTSDGPILAASAIGREQADPRRWVALIVLLLAAFVPSQSGGEHAAPARCPFRP